MSAGKTVDELGPKEFPNEPLIITDETFEKTLNRFPIVVVDCWAPWCGPCKMLAPTIDTLAKEYANKVVFGKLNTDENQKIAMKYRIMAIPTLLIFKNKELKDQVVGLVPKDQIGLKLRQYL